MARQNRYEKERASWLLAHEASWHLSDRRMADALKRRATKNERGTAGAADGLTHEGKLKSVLERFIFRGDDAGERTARIAFVLFILLPAVFLLAGPALVAAAGLYLLTTTVQLAWLRSKAEIPASLAWTRTPPRAWPWLVVGGVVLVVAILLNGGGSIVRTFTPWPFELEIDWARMVALWFLGQAVLTPLLTAWNVRRHGWAGVRAERKSSMPKLVVPTAAAGGYEPYTAQAEAVPPLPEMDETEQWIDTTAEASSFVDDEPVAVIVPPLPEVDATEWMDTADDEHEDVVHVPTYDDGEPDWDDLAEIDAETLSAEQYDDLLGAVEVEPERAVMEGTER